MLAHLKIQLGRETSINLSSSYLNHPTKNCHVTRNTPQVTYVFAILIDLFECYNVHMLRNSVSPMYRRFSSPPTATPCITLLVSVCISELRDSVYSICDAVSKEYGKRVGGNGLKKCIKKLCVRLKCKSWLKRLVKNYVEHFGRKVFWEVVLKNCLEEVGGKIV